MIDAQSDLIAKVAGHVHAGQHIDAGALLYEVAGTPGKPKSKAQAIESLSALLYWCLREDRFFDAATLLWTPNLFDCRPRCTKLVWDAFDESSKLLILGGASVSKSHSCLARCFLEWLKDPEFTSVRVVSGSEEHLAKNAFSALVDFHKRASIPLPGIVMDLYIGLDRRSRRASISGEVMPRGKASGKLQGAKCFPRTHPHPVYGPLSRLIVFADEVEKVAVGIWSDFANLIAGNPEKNLKLIAAWNPADPQHPVASMAEPAKGWAAVNPDVDEKWVSKRGWNVLRLDPNRTENIIEGRTVFPGLQTRQGLAELARTYRGEDTPEYYTFGRALYHPGGVATSAIPAVFIPRMRAQAVWVGTPRRVGSCDVALAGRNSCVFAVGSWGWASGVKYSPSVQYPEGRYVQFTSQGAARPRLVLQADQFLTLPPADLLPMVHEIKRVARGLAVEPGWLLLDGSGLGRPVVSLIQEIWSPEVRGLDLSEGCTSLKILEEDANPASEDCYRVNTELWLALKKWIESDAVKVGPEIASEPLHTQLTARTLGTEGMKLKIEEKRVFKSRGFPSPDEADALTLLVHCVRLNTQHTPSMRADSVPIAGSPFNDPDGMPDSETFHDPTALWDDLDSDNDAFAHDFMD